MHFHVPTHQRPPTNITIIVLGLVVAICVGAQLFAKPVLTTRVFKPVDGLAHQVVRDIALAPDGTVGMATWGGGISNFDGAQWKTVNEETTVADFMIRCLVFDS